MKRRVIRKVPMVADRSLEEQLWPVQVGLCVLGGFWVGIVLSFCKFDDPRWFGRPWIWLITTAIVTGGALLLAHRLPRQLMRRAVMLAIVLSLIVNSILLTGMAWTKIFAVPGIDQRQLTHHQDPSPEVVMPEYIMQPIRNRESDQRDVDRPEDTGTVEAVETHVSRQEMNDVQRQPGPSMAVRDSRETADEPHPRIQRETVESTPHRGDAPSLLSRRPIIRPRTVRQRARIVPTDMPATELSQPSPADTSIARSSPSPDREPLASQTTARVPSQQALSTQLARRADDATDTPANIPQARRRVRRPKLAPQTDLVAQADAAVARQTQQTAPLPRDTRLDRAMTAVTEIDRTERGTLPRPMMSPTERAATVADPSREIATTLRPIRRRRAELATKPTVNTLAENMAQTTTATPHERLEPQPTDDVARQRVRTAEIPRRVIRRPEQSLSATEQLAVVERPQSDAEQAAMFDRRQPQKQPTRTARAADIATTRIAQEAPAVATNETPTSEPTAEPARTAITQATGGITGIGKAPNLERGANAAVGQADLAAAFARRNTETQTMPPGLAMAPSQSPRTRSTRSSQNAPATTTQAQQVTVANKRGSARDSVVSASAAATIQKAASSAELSAITTARGDTQVDLGPKRVVRMDTTGRASGGGQPDLNVESQSRLITRSRVGGVRRIALQADRASEVAAPANDGGRQPTVATANPDASSVVQTAFGGASDVSRGKSDSAEVGAPSSATTAEIGLTQASRAESIEAPTAEPVAGGGNRSRALSSQSAFVANLRAEVASVAAADESAGRESAADLTASGESISPVAGGVLAIPQQADIGAVANREPSTGATTRPDLSVAVERGGASRTDIDGDFVGRASIEQRSPRRARMILPSTASMTLRMAPAVASNSVGHASSVAAGATDVGSLARDQADAISFERDAKMGVGGVGDQIVAKAGFDTPRAQSLSEQIELQDARFIRKNVGGPPTTVARVAVAVDAFRHRLQRRGSSERGGGVSLPPKTEEAIELGLVYLSRNQETDGRWRLSTSNRGGEPGPAPTLRSDTAATGLSLLAFLGAGYHHLDDKYANGVRAALDYLVENQSNNGNLYVRDDEVSASSVALYSHAIAALALCEAYGMTQDEWLKEPAQKALDYIVASQNRRLGGWRYTPQLESDTSVTGWMIMALRSGELAQLNVPESVYENTTKWLNGAQASETQRHLYRYNPLAPDTISQRHGRQSTHVMTAVGLLTRMYLGWRRDNQWMQQGGDYLADNVPKMGTSGSAQRDTYYWYYATQVMFHIGGEHWQQWNSNLHPLLVQQQIRQGALAGSWNPYAPVPDRWAVHAGRLYVTAMNLLSLEVYYRHLPIYAETGR